MIKTPLGSAAGGAFRRFRLWSSLGLQARGRSNQEIARALVISEPTVRTHIANILSKLQLADRTQAAIYALQHQVVRLTDALEEER